LYVGLTALAWFIEKVPEWIGTGPENCKPESGYGFRWVYQFQASLAPRKPRSHFVRLIIFRPKAEPREIVDPENRCAQREFFVKFLPRIAAANPALIVIDKTFLPELNCPATADLVKTFQTVAATVPIVVAHADERPCDLPGADEAVSKRLTDEKALVLSPTLPFASPNVYEGVARLEVDTRKLPLQWPMYSSLEAVEHERAKFLPSLALLSAKVYDPNVVSYPLLTTLLKQRKFPYTTFLSEQEIGSFSPVQLLCNGPLPKAGWRTCGAGRSSELSSLRNRVVVIGEQTVKDFHPSPLGRVPGVVLQANYIESLLDDRYLRPSPSALQLMMSLLGLVLIDIIVDQFAAQPKTVQSSRFRFIATAILQFLVGIVVALAAVATLGFVVYDIAIVQFGYYPALAGPSVVGLGYKFIEWLNHLLKEPRAHDSTAAKPDAAKLESAQPTQSGEQQQH
jgi:hypothetical protein